MHFKTENVFYFSDKIYVSGSHSPLILCVARIVVCALKRLDQSTGGLITRNFFYAFCNLSIVRTNSLKLKMSEDYVYFLDSIV